jgi:hypothetical protein
MRIQITYEPVYLGPHAHLISSDPLAQTPVTGLQK